MRNKALITLALAIVPVLSSCETISNWLSTPIGPEPVVVDPQPAPGDQTIPPQPQPPTIADSIIDAVSGAAGAATGNPVVGIVVAGILTAIYGTFRGKVAKKTTPPTTENKV